MKSGFSKNEVQNVLCQYHQIQQNRWLHHKNLGIRLTTVLFPPPEFPTSARVSFLLTLRLKFLSTGTPSSYSKLTFLNSIALLKPF